MKFMMIVKASKDSEAGVMPSEELLSAMGKYNEELMKAGVLRDFPGFSRARRAHASGSRVINAPSSTVLSPRPGN